MFPEGFIHIFSVCNVHRYTRQVSFRIFQHAIYIFLISKNFIQKALCAACNLYRYTRYLLSPNTLTQFVVNFINNVILVIVLIGFCVGNLTARSMFLCAWLFVWSDLNNICPKSLVHFFDESYSAAVSKIIFGINTEIEQK